MLTVFSSFGQTFFIALFSTDIRAAFSLTHGQLGWIYMLATLASACTLIFVGKVVDHASVARVAVVVCGCLACVCATMYFANSVVALTFVFFGLRLFGQGLMTHTAMTAMGRWYERERGRAVSITGLGHQLGEGILPTVVVILLTYLAWTHIWLLAAALLAFFALPAISFLMRKERVPQSAISTSTHQTSRHYTRKEVLNDPIFWILCCTTLTPAFIGTSFFFHQQHIGDVKGWSYTYIATTFSIMAIANIVFALLTGWMVDKWSAVKLLPLYLLPLAAACTILYTLNSESALLIYMLLLGASGGIANTLLSSIWPEIYGTKHLGSIRSLVVAGMVFSSALGPGLTGWLIDKGVDYPDQTLVMALVCILGTAALFYASKVLVER